MIPERLLRYFADSEVEVQGWRPESQELILTIQKEIGPESGTLMFAGVTYMALTSWFTTASISIAPTADARRILPNPDMASDGVVFVIVDIEGVNNIILAQSLS